jgi:hypothetical protein
MRPVFATLAATLLLIGDSAGCQDRHAAQPGARARLVVDGPQGRAFYEGNIVRIVTDTVVLRYPSTNFGAPTHLTAARASLLDFQVSAGAPRKRYAIRGAVIGGVVGALLGAITTPHYETAPGGPGPDTDAGTRIAIGAAGGALLVGFVSAVAAPERWVTVQ